jgi:tetratricopeptide (TPR) repeat protein
MFLYFVILLLLCAHCFAQTTAASHSSKRNSLSGKIRNQIDILREKGHRNYSKRNYREAIDCYSAILQLVEGVSGDEAYELRRRCGLNLAYCCLKNSNYAEAVARCSEVIDESSNFVSEDGETPTLKRNEAVLLRQALATSYKRRGQALKLLGKDNLADIDFSFAKFYNSKTQKLRNSKIAAKYTNYIGDHQDFVEECQLKHPRKFVDKAEILSLSRQSSPLFPSTHGDQLFGNNLDFGSSFGNLKQDINLEQIVRQFGPMLGLSERTTSTVATALHFYSKAYRAVHLVVTEMRKRREIIVMTATAIWILVFFHQQLRFKVNRTTSYLFEMFLRYWRRLTLLKSSMRF